MSITVTPLDTGDAALADRLWEISAAVTAADLPDLPPPDQHSFSLNLREPWPGNDREHFVARDAAGTVLGYAKLDLPVLDNLTIAEAEIEVDPAHRRRGAGRALLAALLDRARALGRKHLAGMAVEQLPGGPGRAGAGAAFAKAAGFSMALAEVRRRLDVTAIDRAVLDDLLTRAWSRAKGYSLVRWRGATPEDLVADVAYLDGRLIQDAPMGDLAWEPQKVDASRVRANEAALARHRRTAYHAGVRHDATGRLAAWTTIGRAQDRRTHGYQWITIVDPDHRGHRLGTIVKIENLYHALAHEPEFVAINTWNAASNKHMISINEVLGFRAVDAWNNWQIDL
ncbi:GNAT family N-acetyltransferase [Rhizomonospora bruguierae]|uniref:GNAT family N-acetyltransferase n=1 Tax=Rhizomonospora bruguierae TaxID=1581705 RepID=UPI001BD12054|nr:GNAT family N-acetyltransferase [Micromonospora sp. NBRC 107566]